MQCFAFRVAADRDVATLLSADKIAREYFRFKKTIGLHICNALPCEWQPIAMLQYCYRRTKLRVRLFILKIPVIEWTMRSHPTATLQRCNRVPN
jgi:hypothetical protein